MFLIYSFRIWCIIKLNNVSTLCFVCTIVWIFGVSSFMQGPYLLLFLDCDLLHLHHELRSSVVFGSFHVIAVRSVFVSMFVCPCRCNIHSVSASPESFFHCGRNIFCYRIVTFFNLWMNILFIILCKSGYITVFSS